MSRRAEPKTPKRPARTAAHRPSVPLPSDGARQPLLSLWTSALVGGLFGALYLVLAPPVTGPKDAAEFTVVLATGGAAHPTGYPLYVMVGHLFVVALHAAGASWASWRRRGGRRARTTVSRPRHDERCRRVLRKAGSGRRARSRWTSGNAPSSTTSPAYVTTAGSRRRRTTYSSPVRTENRRSRWRARCTGCSGSVSG